MMLLSRSCVWGRWIVMFFSRRSIAAASNKPITIGSRRSPSTSFSSINW